MKRIVIILFCTISFIAAQFILPKQAFANIKLSIERLQLIERNEKDNDIDLKLLTALEIIDKMSDEEKWQEIRKLIEIKDFASSKYYDELLYLYSVHLANTLDTNTIDTLWDKIASVQDSIHIFPLMLSRLIAFRSTKKTDRYKIELKRIIQFIDISTPERKIHGPMIEGNIVFGHSIREDYTSGELPKIVTMREYMESPMPLSGFSRETQYISLLESYLRSTLYNNTFEVMYAERIAKLYEKSGEHTKASAHYGHVAGYYMNNNDYGKAMFYIKKALQLDPNNAENIRLKKKIDLGMVLKDGVTSTAKIPVDTPCDNSYFFNHNERLNQKYLEGKTKEQLRLMRNEVFARHGRPFASSDLRVYFSTKCWYRIDTNYSDNILTATDKYNILLIRSFESNIEVGHEKDE